MDEERKSVSISHAATAVVECTFTVLDSWASDNSKMFGVLLSTTIPFARGSDDESDDGPSVWLMGKTWEKFHDAVMRSKSNFGTAEDEESSKVVIDATHHGIKRTVTISVKGAFIKLLVSEWDDDDVWQNQKYAKTAKFGFNNVELKDLVKDLDKEIVKAAESAKED